MEIFNFFSISNFFPSMLRPDDGKTTLLGKICNISPVKAA